MDIDVWSERVHVESVRKNGYKIIEDSALRRVLATVALVRDRGGRGAGIVKDATTRALPTAFDAEAPDDVLLRQAHRGQRICDRRARRVLREHILVSRLRRIDPSRPCG